MNDLTPRDRELVALGAALGSNCVPCIEHHIPEARKAGLGEDEIRAAIQLADKVRQVPARRVLQAALDRLAAPTGAGAGSAPGVGCGSEREAHRPADAGVASAAGAAHTHDFMNEMMSRMKAACGAASSPGSSGAPSASSSAAPSASSAPVPCEGCGCG